MPLPPTSSLCHPLPKHLCAASPRCLPNAASLYNSCHVNHDLWGSLTDIPNCRHVIGCYWQLREGRISGREDQRDEDQQCTVSRSYGWVMQLTSFSSHSALPARQAELLHPECQPDYRIEIRTTWYVSCDSHLISLFPSMAVCIKLEETVKRRLNQIGFSGARAGGGCSIFVFMYTAKSLKYYIIYMPSNIIIQTSATAHIQPRHVPSTTSVCAELNSYLVCLWHSPDI